MSPSDLTRERQHRLRERHPHATWWQSPSSLEERLLLEVVLPLSSSAGLGPFQATTPPLTPALGSDSDVPAALCDADLLRISPMTPVDSIVWVDGTAEPAGHFFPSLVTYQLPGEGDERERRAALEERLPAFELASLSSADRHALPTLVASTLVLEAARYLSFQLTLHRLPALQERHVDEIVSGTQARVGSLTLGRLYSIASTAARATVSIKEQYPQTVQATLQTAVSRFLKGVDAAIDEGHHADEYGLDTRHPLARSTSILFRQLLERNPISTSVDDVVAQLAATSSSCEPPAPWWELRDWFTQAEWSIEEFEAALDRVSQQSWGQSCVEGCHHQGIAGTSLSAHALRRDFAHLGLEGRARGLALVSALVLADEYAPAGSATLEAVRVELMMPTLRSVDDRRSGPTP